MSEHKLRYVRSTNNEQKSWSKKVKILFSIDNWKQKRVNVIILEGTK